MADFFNIISDIAVACGALVAIGGVNTWKKELRWKKLSDAAENYLLLIYSIEDAITEIRSPLSSSSEYADRKVSGEESPEEKDANDSHYVVMSRIRNNKDIIDKIRVIKNQCKALFGNSHTSSIDSLYKIILDIYNSANALREHYWITPDVFINENERENFFEEKRRLEKNIWGTKEDKIGIEINRLVTNAEDTFRPFFAMQEDKNFFGKVCDYIARLITITKTKIGI